MVAHVTTRISGDTICCGQLLTVLGTTQLTFCFVTQLSTTEAENEQ